MWEQRHDIQLQALLDGVSSLFPGRLCHVNSRNEPERPVACSVMQAPLQRNRASSTLTHVQKALEATADQETLYPTTISPRIVVSGRDGSTDDVDEDGNEDGGSYC